MSATDNSTSGVPEWTVGNLSKAIRETLENRFARVRVRGELGRISRPASGHLYFDLREEEAVLSAIIWRSKARYIDFDLKEGLEVVATGRVSAYALSSRYQLIVDSVKPTGLGGLLLAIEERRQRLEREGLFDPARKIPIPFLPEVIGIVTSESGAAVRDILHRLRDRFPRHVLLWPVVVQGPDCPRQVSQAIRGFNALKPGGSPPRPDVLIVARGGGSVEDLAGFSDEQVVRATAESEIPVISGVGHETDTTLIDFAADYRAPTPSAAAECAVPVRSELRSDLGSLNARQARAWAQTCRNARLQLRSARTTLRPIDEYLAERAQRVDSAGSALAGALRTRAERATSRFHTQKGRLSPQLLRERLKTTDVQLARSMQALTASVRSCIRRDEHRIDTEDDALLDALRLRVERATSNFRVQKGRLHPQLLRGRLRTANINLANSTHGLTAGIRSSVRRSEDRVSVATRLMESVGHRATLGRGYAIVRRASDDRVIPRGRALAGGTALRLEFQDCYYPATAGTAPAETE